MDFRAQLEMLLFAALEGKKTREKWELKDRKMYRFSQKMGSATKTSSLFLITIKQTTIKVLLRKKRLDIKLHLCTVAISLVQER